MVARYLASGYINWDLIMSFVTYAYDAATQVTKGFPPLFLLRGRERSTIHDTIFPCRPDGSNATLSSYLQREYERLASSLITADQWQS